MTKISDGKSISENMSQRLLARYLGVSEPTLRRHLKEKSCDLPFRKLGSRYIFSKSAVDRWLARQDESGAA